MNARAEHEVSLTQDISSGLFLGGVLLVTAALAMRPMLAGFDDPSVTNAMVTSLVVLLACVVLVRAILERELVLPSPWISIPLAALLLCGLLALLLAGHRWPAELHLMAWLTNVVFFFAASALCARAGGEGNAARRVVVAATLATVAVVALYGVYQRAAVMPTLLEEMTRDPRGRELLKIPGAVGRVQSGEVFATFVTPNAYAGYLAMLLPPAAGALLAALASRRRLAVICASVLAITLCLALLFTGSPGGWAAAAAGIAAGAYVFRGRGAIDWLRTRLPSAPLPRYAILGGTAAAGAIAAVALAFAVFGAQPMQVRCEYWKATVGMIADHPMGVGLSNFADVYPRYKTPAGMETREPHNVYLGLLAEAGPLALIALGALLYGCVRLGRAAQTPSAAPSDETAMRVRVLALAGGLSGVFAAYLVGAFSATGMHAESIWMMLSGRAEFGTVVSALSHIAFFPLWFLLFVVFFEEGESPALRAGLLGAVAALLVHGLVEFDFKIKTTMLVACAIGAVTFSAVRPRTLSLRGARAVPAVACALLLLVPLLWRGSSRIVRMWEVAELADGEIDRSQQLENAARELAAAASSDDYDAVEAAITPIDDPELRVPVANVFDAMSIGSRERLRRAASDFGMAARQEARRSLSKAWDHLSAYVETEPGDTRRVLSLVRLGELLSVWRAHADMHETTERAIRRLADRAPEGFEGWLVLGRFHARHGHLTQAAAAFRKAATRYPLNPEIWLHLGDARIFFDPERAVEAYARALEVNGAIEDENTMLFSRLWESSPVRPRSGGLAAKLDAQETTPEIAFRRGLIHWRIGGFAQAADDFAKALELRPGDPQFAAFRALILEMEFGRAETEETRRRSEAAWKEFLKLQRAAPPERRLPERTVQLFERYHPALHRAARGMTGP